MSKGEMDKPRLIEALRIANEDAETVRDDALEAAANVAASLSDEVGEEIAEAIRALKSTRNAELADLKEDNAELEKIRETLRTERDAARAQLAAKDARITQLVAALDTHHGTPCEQIRHEEELATKSAKIAELQLRNTSLRVERDDLFAQLAVKDAEIAHLAECLILSLGSIEEGVLVRNVRAQLAAKDAEIAALQSPDYVSSWAWSTHVNPLLDANERELSALREAIKVADMVFNQARLFNRDTDATWSALRDEWEKCRASVRSFNND